MTFEFWPAEREAFRPPTDISLSEWAERYRILDEKSSSEHGPWRNDRVPYLVAIMDAFTDDQIREITLEKAAQMAGSEFLLNALGYLIDEAPGPVMLVYPREKDCKDFMTIRIQPMVEACDRLQRKLTGRKWDVTKLQIIFQSCVIYMASSKSPADVSQRAVRYLLLDEIDRFGTWTMGEGSPLELAKDRTTTYLYDRKIAKISTPTTPDNHIHQEFLASDQRHYWCQCPACSEYQIVVFRQIKVEPDVRDPEAIRTGLLAWYECIHCGHQIKDGGRERTDFIASGVWCPKGGRVDTRGRVIDATWSSHAGFHLWAGLSPWRTWSEIIAEFFRIKERPAKLRAFINTWLGEPWTETVVDREEEELRRLIIPYKLGTVPAGVRGITAGVDVQQDCFYYSIRGWGEEMRSWLIDAGILQTWEGVVKHVLLSTWSGQPVLLANIDSSYEPWEVYEIAMAYPDIARPIKGESRSTGLPYRASRIERNPVTGATIPQGILLWLLNTGLFKDRITRLQEDHDGKGALWHLPEDISDEYLLHLRGEYKIIVRNKKTGAHAYQWTARYHGVKNHFWDCEVYALAAAQMAGLYGPQAPVRAAREETPTRPGASPLTKDAGWARTRGGPWIPRRGGGWAR